MYQKACNSLSCQWIPCGISTKSDKTPLFLKVILLSFWANLISWVIFVCRMVFIWKKIHSLAGGRNEKDSELNTQKIGNNFIISHIFVWKIVYDFVLHSYHIQWVQALLPRNFALRMNFYQWFLQNVFKNPLFDAEILFKDVANFSRNAIQNFLNNHFRVEKNPQGTLGSRHQKQ